MKVSKTQLEVLRLMAGEWELGRTASGGNSSYWIQKDGLGRGGKVKKLRYTTGVTLYKKGLIKTASSEFRYPTTNYRLTEKGRKVVEENEMSKLNAVAEKVGENWSKDVSAVEAIKEDREKRYR